MPAAQTRHCDAPLAPATLPEAQSRHASDPRASENWPGSHALHLASAVYPVPVAKAPLGHAVQLPAEEAASPVWYVPPGQEAHVVALAAGA